MPFDEKQLEKFKTSIFRLHFLLTENQSPEIVKQGISQFKFCFELAFKSLAIFIEDEYSRKTKKPADILEASLELALFNAQTIKALEEMVDDFGKLNKSPNSAIVYQSIQTNYARLLQMVYDMLARMGEEAPEEDE